MTPNTEKITYFGPTGNLTMFFDQIDYYGNPMEPGMYGVEASFGYPTVKDGIFMQHIIHQNATFTILSK